MKLERRTVPVPMRAVPGAVAGARRKARLGIFTPPRQERRLPSARPPEGTLAAAGWATLWSPTNDDVPGAAPAAPAAALPEGEGAPLEALSRRLADLALAAPKGARAAELVLSGGQLEGVICRLDFRGRSVACRLRAPGAVTRGLLGEARRLLSARLQRDGFSLELFEVGA